MVSLIDKLKKNSTIDDADILSESKFFTEKDMIQTPVPALNIALAGRLDGGLTPGIVVFAGPSKNFKSGFSLLLVKSYMEKYPDAALLFYDSEFGTPKSYWKSFGIDQDRVLHSPIVNIENLTFDLVAQLENVERGEHLIIVIDSLGNVASKKEVEDAKASKGTEDMTRAKKLKALFRIVGPYLNMKDIPMVVVAHTYKTLEMFSKDVMSGGTGAYYNADSIFILGRQQDADKEDGKKVLNGYNFIINVEKSRYVKEKSKIPIRVSFESGISKYSGLFDLAKESGDIVKSINPKTGKESKSGWVRTCLQMDEETTEDEMETKEFWDPILRSRKFQDFIKNKYYLTENDIMSDSEIEIYDEEIKKALNEE
jgi:RecA/RadA recombinase